MHCSAILSLRLIDTKQFINGEWFAYLINCMHYSSDEPHASPISIINRMAINCRTANIWFEQPSLSQSKCKQCPHKGDKFMGSLMRTTLLYITHTINIHLWFVGFKIVCITYNTHTHTHAPSNMCMRNDNDTTCNIGCDLNESCVISLNMQPESLYAYLVCM